MAGASLRSGTGTSATRLQRVAAHVVAAAAAAAAASKLLPPRVEQLRHEVQAARQPPPHHTSRLEELLAARLALSRLQDAEQHAAAVTQEAASIRELQLERFAVELDTRGWTVVPPTITGLTPQRVEALRRAIYRVAEERQQQVANHHHKQHQHEQQQAAYWQQLAAYRLAGWHWDGCQWVKADTMATRAYRGSVSNAKSMYEAGCAAAAPTEAEELAPLRHGVSWLQDIQNAAPGARKRKVEEPPHNDSAKLFVLRKVSAWLVAWWGASGSSWQRTNPAHQP